MEAADSLEGDGIGNAQHGLNCETHKTGLCLAST